MLLYKCSCDVQTVERLRRSGTMLLPRYPAVYCMPYLSWFEHNAGAGGSEREPWYGPPRGQMQTVLQGKHFALVMYCNKCIIIYDHSLEILEDSIKPYCVSSPLPYYGVL